MNYDEIIDIIQSKKKFGTAYGRDITADMMGLLGHPESDMNIIHIAGTNGKGSTAAFVSSILQAAGFVVGQYTSPHLVRFTERIQVMGNEISEEEMAELGEIILNLDMKYEPTLSDICLGIAVLYFKKRKCDYVILETGLGGAKDSTSGLDVIPVACGFSNIGLDHTAILGNTIEEIAKEKAGILKKGTTAVVGIMDSKAAKVIKKCAEELEVDVKNVDNLLTKISTWEIPLNGGFQRENLALAMGLVETVFNNKSGYLLDKYKEENSAGIIDENSSENDFLNWKMQLIKNGIQGTKWPGRMEIISENPFIMVDGAHNPQGVEALFNSLKCTYPEEHFTMIMGVMADKDYREMINVIKPISSRFITVTVECNRSESGKELAEVIGDLGCEALYALDIADAISIATRFQDKIIVFGSLYFIGEVLKQYGTD
ncbi:MAG: bifunctional folylpolyglutamate synthase/dihydrofolate synthase [Lachnospiraceae bacterium]|nr:bifunctional folylpolyglutamate synthase/dihydrofolate synthase [Lachnospiraceae bacterium]